MLQNLGLWIVVIAAFFALLWLGSVGVDAWMDAIGWH